ncbi:MAG: tetratricopeptide repeat protein [Owenweeksia sp.]|nr:tetratricopeptide repeat protein [Owenweeksia sp.]
MQTDTLNSLRISGLLGSIYQSKNQYQKSLNYYQEAMQLCQQGGYMDRYFKILFNSTTTLVDLGRYNTALEKMLECQKYFEAQERHDNVAVLHNNLGLLYLENLNEPDKAKNQFDKAIAINKKANNQWNLARNYNNLSLVYISKGLLDSANYYLDQAIAKRKQENSEAGLATLYNAKGELYLKLKDYSTAVQFFQKSQDISKRYGITEGLYFTNIALGIAYDSLGTVTEPRVILTMP